MLAMNFIEYTVAQETPLTYTLTPSGDFGRVLPENVMLSVAIHEAPKFLVCKGVRIGTTFTVKEFIESDTASDIPTFGAGAKLISTPIAQDANKLNGRNLIMVMGDSNAGIVWTAGAGGDFDKLDYIDTDILEWTDINDPFVYDNNYGTWDHRLAACPLYDAGAGTIAATDRIDVALLLCKQLKGKGLSNVSVSRISASGFDTWVWGQDLEQMHWKHMLNRWGAENPANDLKCIVVYSGTNSGYQGIAASSFEIATDVFINAIRASATQSLGRDCSRLPMVFIGQAGGVISIGDRVADPVYGTVTYASVEAVLADIPNRHGHTAYVYAGGLTADGGNYLHFGGAAQRILGSELIPAALIAAQENFPEQTAIPKLTVNVSGITSSNSMATATMDTVVVDAPADPLVINAVTGMTFSTSMATASMDTVVTVPPTFGTTPQIVQDEGFQFALHESVGLTRAGDNFIEWANQGSWGGLARSQAANDFTIVADGLQRGAVAHRLLATLPHDPFNNEAGSTVIIDFTPTSHGWFFGINSRMGISSETVQYGEPRAFVAVATETPVTLNQRTQVAFTIGDSGSGLVALRSVNGAAYTSVANVGTTPGSLTLGDFVLHILATKSFQNPMGLTLHNVLIRTGGQDLPHATLTDILAALAAL